MKLQLTDQEDILKTLLKRQQILILEKIINLKILKLMKILKMLCLYRDYEAI